MQCLRSNIGMVVSRVRTHWSTRIDVSWQAELVWCRMDPLWNSLVVGGLQSDKEGQLKPFLGFIGMIGTHYEDAHIATGVLASSVESFMHHFYHRRHLLHERYLPCRRTSLSPYVPCMFQTPCHRSFNTASRCVCKSGRFILCVCEVVLILTS